MKKTKRIILITLALCLIASTGWTQTQRSGIRPYWVRDAQDLHLWLRGNFIYQDEEIEYWKRPFETVSDMGGDCEDFAFLVKHILNDLFIRSQVILVIFKGEDIGHAIAIFKEYDGTISYFSNRDYRKIKSKTFLDLLNSDYPNWESYQVVTNNRKVIRQIYR